MNHKLLTTVALVALSLQLSSCSPLKPDHPQVKESFKERRAPRDNTMAASGSLSDQKSSNFQPVNPTKVIDNSPTTATTIVPAAIPQIPSSLPSATTPGNFFDRLWGKFSAINLPATATKVATRKPSEANVEQGSTSSGYSYYDMANEILPAHPVPKIQQMAVKTMSSDFGYLSTPDGYSVINAAQAQDAPATTPPAMVPPPVPGAPAMVAPTVSAPAMPDPTVLPPTTPPSADTSSAHMMPTAHTKPAVNASGLTPQAPEMPRMDTSATPVAVPPAPKPMLEQKIEMPKAPSIPANEQIKNNHAHAPAPELSQIPAKPAQHQAQAVAEAPKAVAAVKATKASTKKKGKHKHKKHHVTKHVSSPGRDSGDPYTQKPIPAEVSRQLTGDEKVTGYLK
ncbi:MAG: hypothetical protein ACHP6I_03000 [Rickettsiales bacterium]